MLRLGGGVEFQTNPMTLQSECPVAVCVLQNEPALCPSSAGSKGMERAGSRSVQECHLGSPVGKGPSTRAWSSSVEPHDFCELMPKPCAKLNPVPITHILQQGNIGLSAPSLRVGTGSCLLLGLLSTAGMSKTTAVKAGELLIPTVI